VKLKEYFTIGEMLDLGCSLFEVKGFAGSRTLYLKSQSRRVDCFFKQGEKIDVKGIPWQIKEIADKGRILCLVFDQSWRNKEKSHENK